MTLTTKEEKERYVDVNQWDIEDPQFWDFYNRLLKDAVRCEELEKNPLLVHTSGLLMQQRIDKLTKGLREVKESIEWILETCDGEDYWGHLEDTAREIEEILK